MAIKTNASGFILAHNHPSGNCKPSEADMALTKQITQSAKMFNMMCLDHLIITEEGYYSFADNGLV